MPVRGDTDPSLDPSSQGPQEKSGLTPFHQQPNVMPLDTTLYARVRESDLKAFETLGHSGPEVDLAEESRIRAWSVGVLVPSVLDGDPRTMDRSELAHAWKPWEGLFAEAAQLKPDPEEILEAKALASRMRSHVRTEALTDAELVLYMRPIQAALDEVHSRR